MTQAPNPESAAIKMPATHFRAWRALGIASVGGTCGRVSTAPSKTCFSSRTKSPAVGHRSSGFWRDSGARRRRWPAAQVAEAKTPGAVLDENGGTNHGRAIAVERAPRGQHFEQDRSEREQVATCVHLAAGDLFGSHVADRTQNGAGARHVRLVTFERLGSAKNGPRQESYRQWSHRRLAVPHPSAGISRGQNREASRHLRSA